MKRCQSEPSLGGVGLCQEISHPEVEPDKVVLACTPSAPKAQQEGSKFTKAHRHLTWQCGSLDFPEMSSLQVWRDRDMALGGGADNPTGH